MTRGALRMLIVIALAACGDDSGVVDASTADAGTDASDAGDAQREPANCEERFIAVATGLQPVVYSGRRTLIGATSNIASGELIALWLDTDTVAESQLLRVDSNDSLLFLYGTLCPSLRIEECGQYWVPASGSLYVERLGTEPGQIVRLVVGDLVMVPAELNLDTFEATLTTSDRCRYLERLDLGGRLLTTTCDPPNDPICVLDTQL